MSKQREIKLGFVDLAGDTNPDSKKTYKVKSSSDISMQNIGYPKESFEKRLDLTLISFFIEDLPDFTSNNEGLVKIEINTRNPQNTAEKMDVATAVQFVVKDGDYAPGVDNRGVFRNIIFRDFVNLGLSLIEIDGDFTATYNKVKGIINRVDGLKTLDILDGIPYLNLATSLVDGLITAFGKNEDDVVWSNLPLLDLDPGPGVAFLRSGIYIAFEAKNATNGSSIDFSDIVFNDGKVKLRDGVTIKGGLPNCLAFSLRIRPYEKEIA